MNKYHISKKNYIGRVLATFFFACTLGILVLAVFAFDGETEKLIVDEVTAILLFFVPFFIIMIAGLIFQWIIMRKHVFYDGEDNFIVEKGLFYKREVKVPYKNINTIAIKRSLLDLILNTSKVELDSGTTVQPLPEGRLMVSKKYAEVLKDFLENKKHNPSLILESPEEFKEVFSDEEGLVYKATNKELMLYGLLRPGFLMFVAIMILVVSVIMQIAYSTGELNITLIQFVFIVIAESFGLLLIAMFFASLANLIVFYGYKLKIYNGYIEYEYGLISRSIFKFKQEKINAIYLKQSLGLKFYKLYSLQVSIIGIGEFNQNSDDNKSQYESKYLLPIADKEKVLEVLNLLDKTDVDAEEFVGPTRLRKLNFIYLPLIMPTLILIAYLIMFFPNLLNYIIVTINLFIVYGIIIVALVLRLKNHGYITNNDLIIRKGSFTIIKQLVNRKRIQEVSYKQGPIAQLLKVGKIVFKYKMLLGTVFLSCYTKEEFAKIREIAQ